MSDPSLDGGCLCGAVRYHVTAAPSAVLYCHCRMCQRAAGAPVVAWFTVPVAGLHWLNGEPRVHRSSDGAVRLSCPACGSQLAFQADSVPDRLDLTVASLDRPAGLVPTYHCWTASQLPWFDTDDTLPRYRQAHASQPAKDEEA